MAKQFDMSSLSMILRVLALVIAVVWLFTEFGWVSIANIPWMPLVFVVYILGKVMKYPLFK